MNGPRDDTGDIWVFGYGSLMWRPGFAHRAVVPALLRGYHRAFCVTSFRHRGTRDRPGLVLGLDRGGSCRGRAYRVADDKAEAVRRYLYDREMEYEVYRQLMCRVGLDDGRRVAALCHVVNRSCRQYTGRLSEQRTVALIRQGWGIMGSCGEYLANTVRHLDEMGLANGPLHRLEALVRVADRAGD